MGEGCRRAIALASIVFVASAAAPLSAQPRKAGAKDATAKEAAAAQQAFDEAQRLFDERKYEQALELFRQVYAATKSPNAHIMIGSSLIALGRPVEAYDEMAATMREAAKRAETEPKYAATRDSAAQQLAVLEPKVGKVVVALDDPAAAASVTLNGAPLAPERIGVPVAVNPGSVVILATPTGGGPQMRRDVTVNPGEMKTISIVFTREEPRDKEPIIVDTSAPRETGGGVRTAGFVVAGLGVAGMAVFGVAGMMVQGKLSTLDEECGGARCADPKYVDVIESGKTLALVTNIGLGVGIAGLVSGGLMIALGGPKKAAPAGAPGSTAPAAAASIGVFPGGASIQVAGAF
jgi:hypothetical protein